MRYSQFSLKRRCPLPHSRKKLGLTRAPPCFRQVCVSWQKEGLCKKFDTMGKCAFDHPPQQVTDPFEKRAMLLVCGESNAGSWIEPPSPDSVTNGSTEKRVSGRKRREQEEADKVRTTAFSAPRCCFRR